MSYFDPDKFIRCCEELGLDRSYYPPILALKDIRRQTPTTEILAGRAMRDLLIQFNNKLGNGSHKGDIILDSFAAGDFLEELSKYEIAPTPMGRYRRHLRAPEGIEDYFTHAQEIVEDAKERSGHGWRLDDSSIPCMYMRAERGR